MLFVYGWMDECACACTYARMYLLTIVCMYVCMYVWCVCVCVYVCVYVCMYVCSACMHVRMCVNVAREGGMDGRIVTCICVHAWHACSICRVYVCMSEVLHGLDGA